MYKIHEKYICQLLKIKFVLMECMRVVCFMNLDFRIIIRLKI